LFGHVVNEQRAHSIERELLPHVGEEQDCQSPWLAEPLVRARMAAQELVHTGIRLRNVRNIRRHIRGEPVPLR